MREEGYYKVLYNGLWEISYFEGGTWTMCGWGNWLQDADFDEIGETKIQLP